jgi:hypothetical protein
VVNTIHTILVLSFLGVTGLLLAMTTLHRLRIRGVRMTWYSPKLTTIPVWPTLFIGLVIVFLVYVQNTAPLLNSWIFGGYFLGGIFWFVAVALSSTAVITEYGIIPEAGRSNDAVGWGQISDYFEVDEGKRTHFAFLYQDFMGERQRLDLLVPMQNVERFRSLIRSKLDVQIDHPVQRISSRKALEN